ncbi:Uncharacterised protein [Acinetobacter baumannii]|nr:Uncharacterised protein [Acinetobacter baumannii]
MYINLLQKNAFLKSEQLANDCSHANVSVLL